jgi:Fe-S-cluster-containing hydrogenase component 2
MIKILYIDPKKCSGCRTCEIICSIKNEGFVNPSLSRIQLINYKYQGLRIPMTCQQCEDPVCGSVCPVGALKRDVDMGVVKFDREKCMGCNLCLSVCPFGAIGINTRTGKIFKCEHCGGDPECVKFCEDKAITYVEGDKISRDKRWQVVQDLSKAFEKYVLR